MTGRALRLVTIDTALCTWCLGDNGTHAPGCYVGRALAAHCEACAQPVHKDGLCRDHWLEFLKAALRVHENDNAKTGL